MTRYLSLITFTEQGIKNVKQTTERAEKFRSSVEAAGGKILSQYWAVGEADGCIVFEAPNEETAASLLLTLGQKGNVRTRTLRLYDATEFQKILSNA